MAKPTDSTGKKKPKFKVEPGLYSFSNDGVGKATAKLYAAASGGAKKAAAKKYPNETKQVTVTQAGTTSGGKTLLPKYKTVTTKNNQALRQAAIEKAIVKLQAKLEGEKAKAKAAKLKAKNK